MSFEGLTKLFFASHRPCFLLCARDEHTDERTLLERHEMQST